MMAQLVSAMLTRVPILPRRVLVFRASHVLKDKINKALSSEARGATRAAT